MNTVLIGKCMHVNPTEEQRLEAKKYQNDLNEKLQKLDDKAYEILYICQANHKHMNIDEIDHYVDELTELQNQRIKLTGGRFSYPLQILTKNFLKYLEVLWIQKYQTGTRYQLHF